MSEPLLSTKLFVPQLRANVVPRPSLMDRFNQSLQPGLKLVLVSAPAGFGKTTSVAEWLNQLDEAERQQAPTSPKDSTTKKKPYGWLSLDEGDNDPILFFTYVMAALRGIDEAIGESALSALLSPASAGLEMVLTLLINDLAEIGGPIFLILDDYHVIQSAAIHEQITFLLDHLPAQMRLIVITREDPLLPVVRLRAAGQILEIRQEELRFARDEISYFLRKCMGIDLPVNEVEALERRTEGWIAGLQLAALSMKDRDDYTAFVEAFTGSSRFILDYLIDEVFERQPPEIKEFLLKTSVLERLSGPLCDAVLEREGSQELLEFLEQANLFVVQLDQSRHWYRYHRLFAESLRHRLRSSQQEGESSLHMRASQWFEAEGLKAAAIDHALAAQDWPRAIELIGQADDRLLKRGELVTLIRWFEQLPEELVLSRPDAGLSYAWALVLIGQLDRGEALLAHYEEIGKEIPVLQGQIATAQAFSARSKGDNQRVIEKSKLALELLPDDDIVSRSTLLLNLGLVYWHEGDLQKAEPVLMDAYELSAKAGNHYGSTAARIFLARTAAAKGKLTEAEKTLRETVQVRENLPIQSLAHYDLATITYERNDLQSAEDHLQQGISIATASGHEDFQNAGYMLRVSLLLAQGDIPGATAAAKRLQLLSKNSGPAIRARSMACLVQLALALEDTAKARELIEQMSVDADAHSFYRFIGLMKARLALTEGDKAGAKQMLESSFDTATKAGWGYALAAIRPLQALAAEGQGEAVDLLSEALTLSSAEGYIRSYVDAGQALIPLLQESARRGTNPDYIGRILDAYGDIGKPMAALVEQLSNREIEVLRLMAAGMSNREIAGKLFISTGTAKTHVHNVCGKLGARNRTEAAARAIELGLI